MNQLLDLRVEEGGERLDRYVSRRFPELSRAAIQRLVEAGDISVDGRERKAGYRLQKGSVVQVRFPPPQAATVRAEAIPLEIVFEDEDVIVVNKPAGMVVHPAVGHSSGTLVNAVLAHAPGIAVGGEQRPGIVHRLDADTSGLILVAKHDRALHQLQAQFASRTVHKTYLALLDGHIAPSQGKVDAPIGRDPRHRQRMAVISTGHARQAVTIFRTVETIGAYSLIQAEPQTGRTHQIRVHMAFVGYPVVGDTLYGRRKNALGLDRQFLHAWKLSFVLPSGSPMTCSAPLPDDLVECLERLGFDFGQIEGE